MPRPLRSRCPGTRLPCSARPKAPPLAHPQGLRALPDCGSGSPAQPSRNTVRRFPIASRTSRVRRGRCARSPVSTFETKDSSLPYTATVPGSSPSRRAKDASDSPSPSRAARSSSAEGQGLRPGVVAQKVEDAVAGSAGRGPSGRAPKLRSEAAGSRIAAATLPLWETAVEAHAAEVLAQGLDLRGSRRAGICVRGG